MPAHLVSSGYCPISSARTKAARKGLSLLVAPTGLPVLAILLSLKLLVLLLICNSFDVGYLLALSNSASVPIGAEGLLLGMNVRLLCNQVRPARFHCSERSARCGLALLALMNSEIVSPCSSSNLFFFYHVLSPLYSRLLELLSS